MDTATSPIHKGSSPSEEHLQPKPGSFFPASTQPPSGAGPSKGSKTTRYETCTIGTSTQTEAPTYIEMPTPPPRIHMVDKGVTARPMQTNRHGDRHGSAASSHMLSGIFDNLPLGRTSGDSSDDNHSHSPRSRRSHSCSSVCSLTARHNNALAAPSPKLRSPQLRSPQLRQAKQAQCTFDSTTRDALEAAKKAGLIGGGEVYNTRSPQLRQAKQVQSTFDSTTRDALEAAKKAGLIGGGEVYNTRKPPPAVDQLGTSASSTGAPNDVHNAHQSTELPGIRSAPGTPGVSASGEDFRRRRSILKSPRLVGGGSGRSGRRSASPLTGPLPMPSPRTTSEVRKQLALTEKKDAGTTDTSGVRKEKAPVPKEMESVSPHGPPAAAAEQDGPSGTSTAHESERPASKPRMHTDTLRTPELTHTSGSGPVDMVVDLEYVRTPSPHRGGVASSVSAATPGNSLERVADGALVPGRGRLKLAVAGGLRQAQLERMSAEGLQLGRPAGPSAGEPTVSFSGDASSDPDAVSVVLDF